MKRWGLKKVWENEVKSGVDRVLFLNYRKTSTLGKSVASLAQENRSGRSKSLALLIAPAIISAFVHMVSLPGKSHYPAVPLFLRCFLRVQCDFRARASAPFNASNTIKESSLNDVGLDGRASGCPGACELLLLLLRPEREKRAAILPRRVNSSPAIPPRPNKKTHSVINSVV